MSKSVFKKIINGELPSHKIYEDATTLAFLDINPLTPGHTLVIPKEDINHLDDCPPELYAEIFATVHKVSKQLKKSFKPKRVAIVVHGLDVPHAHVHVLPLYEGSEIKLADRKESSPDHKKLTEVARKLRF